MGNHYWSTLNKSLNSMTIFKHCWWMLWGGLWGEMRSSNASRQFHRKWTCQVHTTPHIKPHTHHTTHKTPWFIWRQRWHEVFYTIFSRKFYKLKQKQTSCSHSRPFTSKYHSKHSVGVMDVTKKSTFESNCPSFDTNKNLWWKVYI